MRLFEILNENSERFKTAAESKLTGTVVYHGTPSSNLTKIMRNGLGPRPNKWIHNNRYQGSVTKFAPGERKEVAELSTTTELDNAKGYAAQGGSVGWGFGGPGVVVGFKILDNDIVSTSGFDVDEIVFKNIISPDRLKIVFPERLVGKESRYHEKAKEFKSNSSAKAEKIKKINKLLKNAGSTSTVNSMNANTPRVRFTGPAREILRWVYHIGNLDLDTPEFEKCLKRELQNPSTEADVKAFWDNKMAEFRNRKA